MDWRHESWKIQDFHLSLLETGMFGDVEFLVGPGNVEPPKKIKAHKFILSVRSSVFETMFGEIWTKDVKDTEENGDSTTTVQSIRIPDAEPELFLSFLKFLYADAFVSTAEEANDLLYLGNKYNIAPLVTRCAELLMSKLTTKNVIGIYRTAILFDQNVLKATALTYLLVRAEQVFQEEEFLSLEVDHLRDLIQMDDLCISELDLFRAVMRWTVADLERNSLPPNPENIRKHLQEKILPHLRLLQMSVEEFSMGVARSGILTPEEIILTFQHFSVTTPSLKSKLPSLPFNMNRRRFEKNPNKITAASFPERLTAGLYLTSAICSTNNQTGSFLGRNGWIHTESTEFSTSRDIEILGIGLFGPGQQRYENGEIRAFLTTYEVEVTLFELIGGSSGRMNTRTTPARHEFGKVKRIVTTRSDFEVNFLRPTFIAAGKIYHIMLAFKGDETRHGSSRLSSTKVETPDGEVTFKFIRGFGKNTLLGHNEAPGRIRSIVFKRPSEPVSVDFYHFGGMGFAENWED